MGSARKYGAWCAAVIAIAAFDRVAAQPPAAPPRALEPTLVDAIAKAEKSVVAIARVRREREGERLPAEFRPNPFGRTPPKPSDAEFVPNEFSAGVVLDAQGRVLTVYHALGDDSDYYVSTHERKTFKARVVGADPRSDLAVLAPEDAAAAIDLTPIALGDAGKLKKGQFVVALGNPYAIARDGQASASWGIVANLGRKAPALYEEGDPNAKSTLHHFGTLLQTDAKLNLGSSGGPLIDLEGQMVGMVTAIPALPGFEESAGYAMPVDAAFRRVAATLAQGREVEYGFLGIQPEALSLAEATRGVPGTRVYRVVSGSPAQRQGIKPGDIIAAVNGAPVRDPDSLVLEVGRLSVDAVVRLRVLRRQERLDLDVELMKYRVRGKKVVTQPAAPWRGMRIDYPTAGDDSLRPVGPLVSVPEAVLVTEVEKGAAAWTAGLRPGMLVSHVEKTPVRTPRDFRTATAAQSGPVRLRVTSENGTPAERVVAGG